LVNSDTANTGKWKTQPHNDNFWSKVNYVTFGLCNGKSVCLSVCNIRALWAQGLTFWRCFASYSFGRRPRCEEIKPEKGRSKQILDAGKQYWKMDASFRTTACILAVSKTHWLYARHDHRCLDACSTVQSSELIYSFNRGGPNSQSQKNTLQDMAPHRFVGGLFGQTV